MVEELVDDFNKMTIAPNQRVGALPICASTKITDGNRSVKRARQ